MFAYRFADMLNFKQIIYTSRYFIAIGLLILLIFSAIGIFISSKFNARSQRITIDNATKVYRLRSNVIRNEFNGFINGLKDAGTIVPLIKNKTIFYQQQPMVDALLLSHPKIKNGWYVVINGRDTVYKSIEKSTSGFQHSSILQYQKEWIQRQLLLNDTSAQQGELLPIADSLHCLIGSRFRLPDSSILMIGLDINFNDLQHYLWSVDTRAQAYSFIIDSAGYYISHPDDKLIGKKSAISREDSGTVQLSDSISSYAIITSSYLQLPVFRFYTPLEIGGMKWTMVVDTPVFVWDEDVKAIEHYLTIMFLAATIIILGLIGWSQAKWRKEFMLRQQSELAAERQQKENALLQLDRLKEKVDPHFLFNSLTSLNGLIEEHPDLAKSFVVKLSRVYRYVLDPPENGLVNVAREITFASEYFFLLRIRFGDALGSLEINISEAHAAAFIPFMSLQSLVENAVKHNVVSKSRPLDISIKSEGDGIFVSNNLQLRSDVNDSGKQGLNYLQSVYAHFGDYQLHTLAQNGLYRCYLPVIVFGFTP